MMMSSTRFQYAAPSATINWGEVFRKTTPRASQLNESLLGEADKSLTNAGVNPNCMLSGLLPGVASSKSEANRKTSAGSPGLLGPDQLRKLNSGVHEKIQFGRPAGQPVVYRHAAFSSITPNLPVAPPPCTPSSGKNPTS